MFVDPCWTLKRSERHGFYQARLALAKLPFGAVAGHVQRVDAIGEGTSKMAKAANHQELNNAFETHLQESVSLRTSAPVVTSARVMEGLIEEGNDMIKEGGDSDVLDAGLIAAAQRVDHYVTAGYGCVRTYARMLGRTRTSA